MLKRAFDFIAATVLLTILTPIMLIIAVAVIRFLGFPIFFPATSPWTPWETFPGNKIQNHA